MKKIVLLSVLIMCMLCGCVDEKTSSSEGLEADNNFIVGESVFFDCEINAPKDGITYELILFEEYQLKFNFSEAYNFNTDRFEKGDGIAFNYDNEVISVEFDELTQDGVIYSIKGVECTNEIVLTASVSDSEVFFIFISINSSANQPC